MTQINIKFSYYKNEIIEALNSKNRLIDEPNYLIDGFINLPIIYKINGDITVWSPIMPMIAVIWNNSGRIYFFPLKELLPNINLDDK